jgi:hypothetical protein
MGDDVITRVSELMSQERYYREQQHQENKQANQENKVLMQSVLSEQKQTNGRVTRLEEAVRILREEFQAIRLRWHSFRDSAQLTIAKVEAAIADIARTAGLVEPGKGELAPVTRLDVKTAVGIFCLGMAAVIALLKLGKGLL